MISDYLANMYTFLDEDLAGNLWRLACASYSGKVARAENENRTGPYHARKSEKTWHHNMRSPSAIERGVYNQQILPSPSALPFLSPQYGDTF